LFGFNMIIAGGGVMELIGILIGHLYFFLTFKYPQDFNGPSLIATPEFLYRWFPNRRGGVRGFGVAPAQAAGGDGGGGGGGGGGNRFGGYQWGQGRRLAD
jgi:derlin-1